MRYNKSEIMKNAWERKRLEDRKFGKNRGMSFGACLRNAWAKAKNAAVIAENKARLVAEKAARVFRGYVNIGWKRDAIEVNTYTGIVTGKTYNWRGELKDFGATWCPGERYWALPLSRVQDFCRKYA